TDNFELDFEPSPSQSTKQMTPERLDQLNQVSDDLGALAEHPRPWGGRPGDRSLRDAVDRQLSDDIGADIDSELAAELAGGGGDDLPFDPDEARAFDRAVRASTPRAEAQALYPGGFDDTRSAIAAGEATSQAVFVDPSDPLSVSGSYDPYGTEAV